MKNEWILWDPEGTRYQESSRRRRLWGMSRSLARNEYHPKSGQTPISVYTPPTPFYSEETSSEKLNNVTQLVNNKQRFWSWICLILSLVLTHCNPQGKTCSVKKTKNQKRAGCPLLVRELPWRYRDILTMFSGKTGFLKMPKRPVMEHGAVMELKAAPWELFLMRERNCPVIYLKKSNCEPQVLQEEVERLSGIRSCGTDSMCGVDFLQNS